jgi:small subunit ribosomal protein S4
MSRYRGPRLKLIRRLGPLPGLTSKEPTRSKKKKNIEKKTQYRVRLEEKQKLRFHYGISERQLLRYVRSARRSKGSTGQTLLQLLEMRLDNIVYRAGIAPTVPAARQLVNHGHIAVNKRVVDIPSYRCQIKDQICIRNGSKINSYKNLSESYNKTLKLPYHLTMTAENASINNIVDRKSVGLKVNELLIVEYYSRQA